MIDCRYQSEMKLNESKIESTGINNWRKKDLLEWMLKANEWGLISQEWMRRRNGMNEFTNGMQWMNEVESDKKNELANGLPNER